VVAFRVTAGAWSSVIAVLGEPIDIDWYASDGAGGNFVSYYVPSVPLSDLLCDWWTTDDGGIRPSPWSTVCPCAP